MATCKDCYFHYESERYDFCEIYTLCINTNNAELHCPKFKDKSKFIELPCKVGEKIYINFWGGNAVPHEVKDISIYINAFQEENMCTCRISDFGKTVFLTREEAEKALENMK